MQRGLSPRCPPKRARACRCGKQNARARAAGTVPVCTTQDARSPCKRQIKHPPPCKRDSPRRNASRITVYEPAEVLSASRAPWGRSLFARTRSAGNSSRCMRVHQGTVPVCTTEQTPRRVHPGARPLLHTLAPVGRLNAHNGRCPYIKTQQIV